MILIRDSFLASAVGSFLEVERVAARGSK